VPLLPIFLFSCDSLIPCRTATQCPSPPYSFGARSRLATVCRCIIVLSSRVSCPHTVSINHKFSLASVGIIKLSLALARLFQGSPGHRDTSFHIADKQALTSLTTFLFGAFIGRIGDRIGAKTRLWLFLGTFIQALFTMAAAISLWKSGQGSVASIRAEPSWTNAHTYACLGLMSASMGLQGIMGKRVNTQFATTSASPLPPFSRHGRANNG
jgi:hypothetical protein